MGLTRGIASGINAGLALVDHYQDRAAQQERQNQLDSDRADDRAYQRERQARQDQRQSANDALSVAGDEETALRGALSDAVQRGIADGSPEATQLRSRAQQVSTDRRLATDKLLGRYDDKMAASRNYLDKIRSGEIKPEDADPMQLGDAISYTTGHPITSFYDGTIGNALGSVDKAFQSGNPAAALPGINTLIGPEISHGIGSTNSAGDTVVGKQIVDAVPHPDDPSHMLVSLGVTAQRPDGTTYTEVKPATASRSDHPDDTLRNVSVPKVMDRLGTYSQTYDALNDPSVKAAIQAKAGQWQQNGGADEFSTLRGAYLASRGTASSLKPKWKTEYHDGAIVKTDDQGNFDVVRLPKDETDAAYKRALTNNLNATADQKRSSGGKSGLLLINADGSQTPYDEGDDIPAGARVVKPGVDRAGDAKPIVVDVPDRYGRSTRMSVLPGKDATGNTVYTPVTVAGSAPSAAPAQTFIPGKKYTDANGNSKIYLGGGQWQ